MKKPYLYGHRVYPEKPILMVKNWAVQNRRICGRVYGHTEFEDGDLFQSSEIATSNSSQQFAEGDRVETFTAIVVLGRKVDHE